MNGAGFVKNVRKEGEEKKGWMDSVLLLSDGFYI